MNNFELIGYPLLPIAGMELLLGFLLLAHNRRSSPANRSVAAMAFFSALFALNTSVMYLAASRGLDFNFFARLNWIGWFAIPAGLQFLFYLRSEKSRAARTTGYIIYPFWTIVLALCLFTDLIVTPEYSLIPFHNTPGPLEIPARIIGALMTVWLVVDIVRVRRKLTGVKKVQIDFFFYGLIMYSVSGVAIAGLMPALQGDAVEPGLAAYFSLPWVVLTFYAIVRYSLFEMRIIFSRTLAVIILVLVFSGLQFGILRTLAPALGTSLAVLASVCLLGFFLFGIPVSSVIQSFVDSFIIGNRYKYEALMREAILTLNSKQEQQELIDYLIVTICAGMHINDAGIYLHRIEDGYLLRQGCGLFSELKNRRSLADIAVQKMQQTNQSLVLAEMTGANEDAETFNLTSSLRGIEAEVLVPLLFQGKLQGALVLGKKTTGEMYGQSDVHFLETLAAHAASALENARLNEITRNIRSSLQQSEERFMTLAHGMPAAVFIHRGGSILYANSAAEEITGYSCTRLKSLSVDDLFLPQFANEPTAISAALGGLKPQAAGREVRVVQENGTQRWGVMTSAVIEYGEQAAVIAILFDITDHKRMEGKIRYERIRDAVFRMAAYLSTDLERLAESLRHIAALQEYGGEGQRYPESAQKIKTAVEQVHILVRTMKEFSAYRGTKRSLQDMNSLVSSRQQILAALLTGKYQLVIQPSPESLRIMADPTRIENALMNLVLNAREQMQRGGAVTIATGKALIDAAFIRRMGFGRMGLYATVTVSDTGEGLTVPEQEKIFEPFFTTHEGWHRNGIGLSVVFDIVKDHEGYITVTSAPGQGSSFSIYLPLAGS